MSRKEVVDKILEFISGYEGYFNFRGNKWYRGSGHYFSIYLIDSETQVLNFDESLQYKIEYCPDRLSFDIDEFWNGLLNYLESGSESGFDIAPYFASTGKEQSLINIEERVEERDKRIKELEKTCSDMHEQLTGSYVSTGRLDAFEEILNKLLDKKSITFDR